MSIKSFRSYLLESVWSEAKKKYDPEIVNQFRELLKAKQVKKYKGKIPNIQQIMKRNEDLEDYVEAAGEQLSYQAHMDKKKEEEEGTKIIFKNDKCVIYKITEFKDAKKYGSLTWCILDDSFTFNDTLRSNKIFIITTPKELKGSDFRVKMSDDTYSEYMFPVCILKNRMDDEMLAWDFTNNQRDDTAGEYIDWIKERVLVPLKIPIEVFK